MKKLINRTNRHKVYKLALELYKKSPNSGMCWHIIRAYETLFPEGYLILFHSIGVYFPELWNYKPVHKESHDSWFDFSQEGKEKRIEILEQCITDTKPRKSKKANKHNKGS